MTRICLRNRFGAFGNCISNEDVDAGWRTKRTGVGPQFAGKFIVQHHQLRSRSSRGGPSLVETVKVAHERIIEGKADRGAHCVDGTGGSGRTAQRNLPSTDLQATGREEPP